MPNFVSTANFSASNGGLATVGFALYNIDGSVRKARSISGVAELGTNSGIYRAVVNYPDNFQGIVLWDTGTGTPVYASDSINPLDAETMVDAMRTQLRSLNTSLSAFLQRKFDGLSREEASESNAKILEQLAWLRDHEENEPDDAEELKTLIKGIRLPEVSELAQSLSKYEQAMEAKFKLFSAVVEKASAQDEEADQKLSGQLDALIKRLESAATQLSVSQSDRAKILANGKLITSSLESMKAEYRKDMNRFVKDLTDALTTMRADGDKIVANALEILFKKLASNGLPEVESSKEMDKEQRQLMLGLGA